MQLHLKISIAYIYLLKSASHDVCYWLQHVLVKDAVIQLISRTSGKTLKVEETDKATVSANGYEGSYGMVDHIMHA